MKEKKSMNEVKWQCNTVYSFLIWTTDQLQPLNAWMIFLQYTCKWFKILPKTTTALINESDPSSTTTLATMMTQFFINNCSHDDDAGHSFINSRGRDDDAARSFINKRGRDAAHSFINNHDQIMMQPDASSTTREWGVHGWWRMTESGQGSPDHSDPEDGAWTMVTLMTGSD